jgi:predicted nuclease of restriction endonuclease-like (RecB) superfamily
VSDRLLSMPQDYEDWVRHLKERIRTAQVRAALAVNQELLFLYWQIGRSIVEQQQQEGWGTKVIERLAKDLRKEFPTIKGFSRSNLGYMKAFAEAYPDEAIVQRSAGKLPWRHNLALIDKLKLRNSDFGTLRKPLRMAGVEMFLPIRSKAICSNGREVLSPTLSALYPKPNLIWQIS